VTKLVHHNTKFITVFTNTDSLISVSPLTNEGATPEILKYMWQRCLINEDYML
jgi:hypothetical protein